MAEPAAPESQVDTEAPAMAGEHKPWHSLAINAALALLGTDVGRGLSGEEAERRLKRFGPNRLAEERRVTFWEVAREEITEPMILLLIAVAALYALSGELLDALAILLVITCVVLVEIYNEYRAKAAVASLQRLAVPTAPALRDGRYQDLPAEELVPGDLVLLRPGERVPADLRLVEAAGLRIDEASLTGESVPVHKSIDPLPEDTELGDRLDMAYAGTLVVAGRGRGVVVATGMATELGRIAGLARAVREPRTPLQQAMRQLAAYLVWLALGFSVLVPALGFLFGQPLREMVLTGLTLAFATIPEELPILITMVLGLGSLRLARRNAIVKRLRAAETLGDVSAIATDKTGTITENRMSVVELRLPGRDATLSPGDVVAIPEGRLLLELGVLANDATPAKTNGREGFAGDPTDVALLAAAVGAGLDPAALQGGGPAEEFTFDDRRKLMSAVYRRDRELLVAAKGAPETILARCDRELDGGVERPLANAARSAALVTAGEMAERGLRVLALAYKRLPGGDVKPSSEAQGPIAVEEAESGLIYTGLAGLLDPPRAEVPAALEELRAAGIRVLMLTGDHPTTARAVASKVGIDGGAVLTGRDIDALDDAGLRSTVEDVSIYARIAPEHKLRIVQALRDRGEVVAVTGDGVNDAPALREAAIGVAMGQAGTDVAKEAAGIVLADDNFATIGVAVREGRKLFENLRKAVRFYLAVKVALVGSSLLAVLMRLPVPFTPIQIIVMELFMDLGASVSFTIEPAEGDVMARPPRDPRRPFMDRGMQGGIFAGGLSLAAAVLAAYLWAFFQGAEPARAQTVAFATWMVGHVLLAFNMRSERQPLLALGPFSNPATVLWGLAAVGLVALSSEVPLLGQALKVAALSPQDWAVAVVAPLLTTSWWEVWKQLRWRRERRGTGRTINR